jgi:hypothetical protein
VSESAWLAYLDTLAPDLAGLARYIIERCASVIADEQRRHLIEVERLEERVVALERLRERAVGE